MTPDRVEHGPGGAAGRVQPDDRQPAPALAAQQSPGPDARLLARALPQPPRERQQAASLSLTLTKNCQMPPSQVASSPGQSVRGGDLVVRALRRFAGKEAWLCLLMGMRSISLLRRLSHGPHGRHANPHVKAAVEMVGGEPRTAPRQTPPC